VYRFLLTKRWIGLALLVIVLVPTFLLLARWQWHRHLTRATYNSAVTDNQALATVPLEQILLPATLTDPVPALPRADLWRNVTVTGTYLPTPRPYVRRRTLNLSNGFWVIAPFVTNTGAIIVVNRGWVPAVGGPATSPSVPAPPTGKRYLPGRLRSSERGATDFPADTPPDQTLALDVTQTAPSGKLVFPGYLEVTTSSPADSAVLTPIPLPELDAGPHVGYAAEWVAFAILAIAGYFIFARKELQTIRSAQATSAVPRAAVDAAG
jgi:cytochrome oxidase assembly protein ShyY1